MSSRTKIVLSVALVLLLAFGAGIFVATWQFIRHRQSQTDLAGFWEGTVAIKHMTLRLVLKMDKAPDGTYTATMDSVDQGAGDIPLNALRVSDGTVQFDLAALQAQYNGSLNARATEIAGEWQQGGARIPVTFKRTKTPSTIAATLPSSAYDKREGSPLQGVWKATLEVGVPLRIVVRISESSPGKFVGTMDSPDQGARNIPLSKAEYSKPTARFDIASIGGQFEGTMKEDGSEIEGTWTQGANSIPCLLTRADPAEDAAPDASAYAFASDADLQGIWNGALTAGRAKLRLVLKIARATNGTYSATMDSPDQGSKGIQATVVSYNAPHVMVEWAALRALFDGELKEGRLVGIWQQGPREFPLELERTNGVTGASASR